MEKVRRTADFVAFLLVDSEFLGLYKKDALLERWRAFWVDREPGVGTPGVVEVEAGNPVRVVSDAPAETEKDLARDGVRVIRSGALDLEEILSHLMRLRRREGIGK